ncbi:cofilin/tropomyosin-type actin-binding protein [Rhizoctonia solani AG-3 Rhs1AP]|uniref:Cofilin/tropomyosin-type actin-binding protein n=2 Tax=Rhizoctonia solani AG-3 TaxID=1086053 RepID=A0A074S7W8_9AGAM|nr:cofilin/tropomyosin-type actin-binding protein [Rhizoctonia solani AG-3 Rhs1AP]KEP55284.1 cofilin/tropomyosin-type actin-binding protein [Rhizoctonia solani 123E]
MSASSGIGVSPELSSTFASAVDSQSTRFIKVTIQNESLVPDGMIPAGSGEFIDDLPRLQDILEDDVPAYILAQVEGSKWLFISYVPDTAKVRDKMVYASTRGALTKALGDQRFKENIFATSKDDLTPEAYQAHQRHLAAPKPLTARERELAEIRAAERASSAAYEGSGVRQSIVGSRAGMKWTDELGEALRDLQPGRLVVISIDPTKEELVLKDSKDVSLDDLPGALPTAEPAYALYSWAQEEGASPHIVFTYTCPPSSPVKHRMLYSSGVASLVNDVKAQAGITVSKRLESSDPTELDLTWLRNELASPGSGSATPVTEDKKPFAKPRGPARRKVM